MKNFKLTGIMPALITPYMADNHSINIKAAEALMDYQLSQGADGFYVLGATGEGLVMNRENRELMCETAVRHVAHRKPVVIHVAAMNMEDTIALAKHAERVGADAIAAVPPSFYYYSAEDILEYYKKIAASVTIPLIVYYHPSAQRNISPALLAKAFEIDNVTGVKWSVGNFFEMMQLKDMTQGDMNIINGPDEMLCCGLMAGADAGIGSTYNVMLPQYLKIYDCVKSGRNAEALEVQLLVNRVVALMIEYEVIPAVKYTAQLMGFDVGDASFPMASLTDESKREYAKRLKGLGFPFN